MPLVLDQNKLKAVINKFTKGINNAKEKFYARLFVDTSSTTLGIPNLFINIAILQQDEEITESTEISAKYEIEAFEEHFCLEDPN